MHFTVKNPLDEGWYADPEARFYEGKYYIYVTHSFPRYAQQLNHTCFVSSDLTNWEKHENIIDMSGNELADIPCHTHGDYVREKVIIAEG